MTKAPDVAPNPLYNRARLADMLAEAAELEHSLCCQYLYAAFSLRRTVDEGPAPFLTPAQVDMVRDFQTVLLDVAKQEMEHLGLVINLQIAIGEAPHLERPNFPLDPQYYETGVDSKLEKFSIPCMQRFVLFELPDDEMTQETKDLLHKYVGWYDPSTHHTIGELYAQIAELMKALDAKGDLFTGPPGAQFKLGDTGQPEQVHRSSQRGIGRAYSIDLNGVTDLKSALATIEQIVEEGEGGTGDRENSHFGKFLNVLITLTEETERCAGTDTPFEPARNLVDNPRSMVPGRGNAQKEGFLITNEQTNKVSRAFDQAYSTMMLLLARFFAGTDQEESDSLALENAAFFPMMTMVIRPLSEVITRLPATDNPAEGNAGPTFRFERRINFLPHRDSAMETIASNLDMVHEALKEVSALDLGDAWLNERISFMVENTWRIAHNFKQATGAGTKTELHA